MNIKKYLIYAVVASTILGGTTSLVLAHEEDIPGFDKNQHEDRVKKSMRGEHEGPEMIVQIGPNGKTTLRGTVKTVGSASLTVTSWGGDWVVNILTSTNVMPVNDLTKFKTGDFVGVHGSVNQSAAFTIDARIVRNWAEKIEVMTNKQEIKRIMKAESSRNWQGTVSNINVSSRSFALTIDDVAYTVNVTADAKIVNEKFATINFADIKNGDRARVWGPSLETTITASVVRDISITP